jgi:hypothetical protein
MEHSRKAVAAATALHGGYAALDFDRVEEGALAARVFVGAIGSSNLPPRTQHRIGAGSSAALEGSDATFLIGL